MIVIGDNIMNQVNDDDIPLEINFAVSFSCYLCKALIESVL